MKKSLFFVTLFVYLLPLLSSNSPLLSLHKVSNYTKNSFEKCNEQNLNSILKCGIKTVKNTKTKKTEYYKIQSVVLSILFPHTNPKALDNSLLK